MLFRRPIARKGPDRFVIRLPDEQRSILPALVPQLVEMIETRDPLAWRLFPNPYADDPLQALQFEEMIGDDLKDRRLAALRTLVDTAQATEVSEEQLMGWMTAVNDIRLVLGTRLDVDEDTSFEDFDEDDPDSHLFAVYGWLGWLLENIVEAVSSG